VVNFFVKRWACAVHCWSYAVGVPCWALAVVLFDRWRGKCLVGLGRQTLCFDVRLAQFFCLVFGVPCWALEFVVCVMRGGRDNILLGSRGQLSVQRWACAFLLLGLCCQSPLAPVGLSRFLFEWRWRKCFTELAWLIFLFSVGRAQLFVGVALSELSVGLSQFLF
jgi:hypothetical protein